MTAWFLYDGGGARVKSTINSTTTYFVGGHYEVTGSQVTKYYFAGGQRIAVRKNGTLSYMLSDHLGSTVATANTSGQLVSGQIYKAWGEVRYSLGTSPTKYTYTGQYSNVSDFGLMFYNARWYDPVSGRFAQADTIVPAGVQGLDRYAYVNNSPLNFVDPSGHLSVCSHANADPECDDETSVTNSPKAKGNGLTNEQIMQLLGIPPSEFLQWREANPDLYKVLQAMNPGEVLRTTWSVDGQTMNLNWMVVYNGKYGGDLAFYSLDQQQIIAPGAFGGDMLQGAGILRDDDGDGIFSTTGIETGTVDMYQYALQPGWNKASDGEGGVAMPFVPNTYTGTAVLGELSIGIPALIALAEAPPVAVAVGVIGFGAMLYGTFGSMDQVPVYYPNFPPR